MRFVSRGLCVCLFLLLFVALFPLNSTLPVHHNVNFMEPHTSSSENTDEGEFRTSNATNYLRLYGWLPDTNKAAGAIMTQEEFQEALRAFQRFANIPDTGVLDNDTITTMRAPRCGVKDFDEHDDDLTQFGRPARVKRFSIEGSYYGVKNLTYKIQTYSQTLASPKVEKVIQRAFEVWEEHSPLHFSRVPQQADSAHINIRFAERGHGDGEPFDGRGNILAHAFFPRYGGDVHFDEDEPWAEPRTPGIDLYSVAAHEIGHSLGLKHSNDHSALMAPFYQGYTGESIHLRSDDIKGIQHLYGKSRPDMTELRKDTKKAETDKNKKTGGTPELAPGTFDICEDPTIDTITVIGNGSTYAFKGSLYWKLNQLSFEPGYPRNISDDWQGLPGDLDASITDYEGDTYFFKGDEYYLYDPQGKRYSGYPRKISVGLVDTPDKIDAGMIWSYDSKPYFFKGDHYWQYSRWGMPRTWPRKITEIDHSLSRIDCALKWTNGKTYIFTGDQYYRLTGWRVMKLVPGYPRDVGEWWFGCPKKNKKRRKRSYGNK